MTARQPLDAPHHRPGGGLTSRERTKVLVSVCASLALVVSAVASLNIALPDLAARTGASQTELQWIVDAYALVFAGLLLIAGAVGDKYGRKHTLVAGLVVFGAAYAFGATVDSPTLLVAARAVAGVGAALAMPSTLSVLTTSFAPAERAKAVGTWAGVAGAGAVLGLLLSGILIEVGVGRGSSPPTHSGRRPPSSWSSPGCRGRATPTTMRSTWSVPCCRPSDWRR